jgi:translation initiation factor 5A
MVGPADSKVDVPIIEKRSGQVVSIGEVVSIMDSESLQIVEVPLPQDESLRSKIEPGVTVEYWTIMGRHLLVGVK